MLKTLRKPGVSFSKTSSISDIAKAAGVSLGTASRVFNGCENVDAELRRQVWLAARTAGYTPRRRAKCIGVVCGRRSPGMALGYVNVMSSLLLDAFMKRGFSVELIDVDHLELAYQSHVNGIAGIVFDNRLKELSRIPNLPVVAVNSDMTADGVHSVFADHFEQGYLAASHFIKFGHKAAGYLAVDPKEHGCSLRIAGCRAAFKDKGLPADAVIVESSLESKPYDILKRWTGRGVKAVFNFSEDCALEAIHILSNVLKLRIGLDVSAISVEDVPVYSFMNPPQTVIRQPLEEIAEKSVEALVSLMERPRENLICERLHSKLIDRDSVAVAKPADKEKT